MHNGFGMLSLPEKTRHLIIKASYYPTVSREEEILICLLTHGATDPNSKIKMDKDQTLSKLIKAGHVEEKNGTFFLTDMGKMVASGALILYPELK